jgi:RNA polymerase sigma-70 factor (ECF subfamily)
MGGVEEPTPVSLLQQLRNPAAPASESAWRRFVQLYAPLLFLWGQRLGACEQDASDLVQETFLVLAREMPAFQYDPDRRFRAWLWTILLNKWRDRARRLAGDPPVVGLEGAEAPSVPDNVAEFAEEEYRAYLLTRALDLIRADLPDLEWRVWQEYVVKGRPADKVADELGVTVNQVYLTKSRTLRRLRAELDGLLD